RHRGRPLQLAGRVVCETNASAGAVEQAGSQSVESFKSDLDSALRRLRSEFHEAEPRRASSVHGCSPRRVSNFNTRAPVAYEQTHPPPRSARQTTSRRT